MQPSFKHSHCNPNIFCQPRFNPSCFGKSFGKSGWFCQPWNMKGCNKSPCFEKAWQRNKWWRKCCRSPFSNPFSCQKKWMKKSFNPYFQ
jgi:hypothetical protein